MVYGLLVTATQWTYEYIDELPLRRLYDLMEYWNGGHPPVHISLPGLFGVKPPSIYLDAETARKRGLPMRVVPSSAPPQEEQSLEALLQMVGQIPGMSIARRKGA